MLLHHGSLPLTFVRLYFKQHCLIKSRLSSCCIASLKVTSSLVAEADNAAVEKQFKVPPHKELVLWKPSITLNSTDTRASVVLFTSDPTPAVMLSTENTKKCHTGKQHAL